MRIIIENKILFTICLREKQKREEETNIYILFMCVRANHREDI